MHVHDMYSGGTRRGCLNWVPQPRLGGAVRQIIGRTWRVGERVLPQSNNPQENSTTRPQSERTKEKRIARIKATIPQRNQSSNQNTPKNMGNREKSNNCV